MSEVRRSQSVGRRVVVVGMAGAGKSTFARALGAATGLPVIHLDVHFWRPGWCEPPDDEWREQQRTLLAGEEWIADGDYPGSLDVRLERADAVIFLDTPWWTCAWRAFMRGIRRRPAGFQLPDGCDESTRRRLRAEWQLAWRICRTRGAERDQELGVLAEHGQHAPLHVLRTKRDAVSLLAAPNP